MIVEHSIKVTYLKGVGWGIRLFRNNVLVKNVVAKFQDQISPTIKDLLRWEDKLGFESDMASASRMRYKK